MELKMKKLFICSILIMFMFSCSDSNHETPRNLEEEFKKSLNGKIFMDNGNNYYMVKYENEVYYGHTIRIYKITKVDKNDVKAFFK